MRVKYFYQQFGSHVSVIVIAILVLSLLFTQFVEKFIYENKIDELTAYGESILTDLEKSEFHSQHVLREYGNVLTSRDIHFSLFDENSAIIYTVEGKRPNITLQDEEWKKITKGETVTVRKDFKRFSEGATFVLLPYIHNGYFVGGILLAAPIKGLSKVISTINQYLLFTVLIALAVSLLLSWVLAKVHVKRINRIKEATSKVAKGDYEIQISSTDFDEIGELAKDRKSTRLNSSHVAISYAVTQFHFLSLHDALPILSTINQYLLFTVLIALAVSLLLSWVLAKVHVKRINRIKEATSKVAKGDYEIQISSTDFDEIGELANDFNNMIQKLRISMEEIEALENRRRQFMADVSHELRTPLTTINGMMEGIMNDMIPESEKAKGLQLASKETKRLIRLVNENLDYEKIRSNQVTLYKEELLLHDVLEVLKDQLVTMAMEKNNKIYLEVTDKLTVFADYDRVIQILINIVKNSIQFTENGFIYLRGKDGKDTTIIEIEDTGIGMNSENIEKIWQRFYKSGLSRSNRLHGEFGLGLSIVKQLVTLHDGKINVTSEEGKGTLFTIHLPKRKEATQSNV